MSDGGSIEGFAGKLSRSKQTIYDWFKAHPEFEEAREIALSKARLYFDELCRNGMWISKDGPNLNTTLWYMNMKNRFGWRDKIEAEVDTKDDSWIDEEWDRVVGSKK